MKNFTKQALAVVAIAAFAVAGCKKGNDGNFDRATGAGGPFTAPDSVIVGNITAPRTLSPGKVYRLSGVVYVTNNAKLTIKAGTVISTGAAVNYRESAGTSGALRSIAGVLVITKGASIDALGSPTRPVIFTSPKAAGSRVAGDFGGVVLLGSATTNKPSTTIIEGLPQYDANGNSLGVDITYGGGNPADNSGRFQYVRIEYAGFKLQENNEINGLTMGGVGSGTSINHVQVSYGADDAFEFFGGTVNASYLLAVGNDDDDFDTDFGYSGNISYAIGLKDPNSTHSVSGTVSDSNGIESDNDNVSGAVATPRNKAAYTNLTLLGYANGPATTLRSGGRWRRNTDVAISNSIIAGFPTGAEFESAPTISSSVAGFQNNIVHGYANSILPASIAGNFPSTDPAGTALNTSLSSNGGFVNISEGLSPFYTSIVAGSYSFDNLQSASKGAVLASNYGEWNAGWVSFIPQTRNDTGL